jgi:S-adenosylmethionine/arginine decarboxylase-like enzyme
MLLRRSTQQREHAIQNRTRRDDFQLFNNTSAGIGTPTWGDTMCWDDASRRIMKNTLTTAPPQSLADQSCKDPEQDEDPSAARCAQLLTTIRFLESEHLRSEESIHNSYMEIVRGANLKDPLFHHCDALSSQARGGGLMCTVIMEDGSKISIATWPELGAAVVDITACGGVDNSRDSMVAQVLPAIQQVFGKQASIEQERKPHVDWNLKQRGLREGHDNPDDFDLDKLLMRPKNIAKQRLASVQTPYQRIDVYNFRTVHGINELVEYNRDLAFAEALPRNRVVLLDYVAQSTLRGEAAYHEALVHPALMAHANPRRVAIIGTCTVAGCV